MSGRHLLPPFRGRAETALAEVAARIFDTPVPVDLVWDPDRCPATLLPWLAWSLGVEDWDRSWSEARKREVIRSAIPQHRRRGTRRALREALIAAGYGDAQVIERFGIKTYDASESHDGAINHAPADHWAEYRVVLQRPITLAQAEFVRGVLRRAAPARCHLKLLSFTAVAHRYDATIAHDGQFTHGAA